MENGFSKRLVGGFILLGVSLAAAASAMAEISIQPAGKSVPGELIVKFSRSAMSVLSASRQSRAVQGKQMLSQMLGASVAVSSVEPFLTDDTLSVVRLADPSKVKQAMQALSLRPEIEYSEPNQILHALDAGTPDDPDLAKTWGLRNVGQSDSAGQVGKAGADINVLPVWAAGKTGSRKVVVAVIDTGIDWTHPDLEANLFTNAAESGPKATNGKDDDGNGFVDDVHGWNFAGKSNNSRDDHNHGTHCAGTIGAVGNNGKGVTGVNWEVTLLPIKFLDAGGSGSLANAVESINYARMMKVDIMSNSWGGGGFNESLKKAIEAARDAGILFVAAAGNESNDNDSSPAYPASYDIANVVSVAATDNRDEIAKFSNWGTSKVHVAAPGVKVYSTVKGGGYEYFSGTSMATPHVAGVAALLLASDSGLKFADLKARLIKTSQPVAGLRRKVVAKGRVNAFNAVNNVIPPSTEPDESLWKTVPYSVESPHPYANNDKLKFEVSRPGAKYVRVVFDKIDVESGYDRVVVENAAGELIDSMTGRSDSKVSDFVTGDKLVIRLDADDSNTAYGFKVSSIQVIE